MLRIDIDQGEKETNLILTGKLTGPWVAELERCWHALISAGPNSQPSPILLDMSKVTFIDEDGKRLISQMRQRGARLAGNGLIAGFICREMEEAWRRRCCEEREKEKEKVKEKEGGIEEV